MMTSAATGSNVAAPPAAPPRGGRKSASLPAETVEYLKSWMMSPDHVAHPYPTEQEKAAIMADTGIELKQLTNWFVNNRKRYWKPRVGAGAAAAPVCEYQVTAPEEEEEAEAAAEEENEEKPCSSDSLRLPAIPASGNLAT